MNRRNFLQTGTLMGTLAASSPLALLAPSRTWAMTPSALNPATAAALLTFCRHLFPHDSMDDAVYALVVKDLDAAAQADGEILTQIEDGIALLNQHADGDWQALSSEAQFIAVEKIVDSGFFEKVRSTCVVSLYNNELAFAHFGYEGESFSQGGYIQRGFQDLDWLPEPSAEASPAVA